MANADEMRLRVLLTNGKKTADLYWMMHNGTDLYYGLAGSDWKDSYHASGVRHSKSKQGEFEKRPHSSRLDSIDRVMCLESIGCSPKYLETDFLPQYTGKKANAVLYIDTRTLPQQISIAVCLVPPGQLNLAMLPILPGLMQILTVTNTNPWVSLMLTDVNKSFEHSRKLFPEAFKDLPA